jgi:hypothetical protein
MVDQETMNTFEQLKRKVLVARSAANQVCGCFYAHFMRILIKWK